VKHEFCGDVLFLFVSGVCFELTGKKNELAKCSGQSAKKKASRTIVNTEQDIITSPKREAVRSSFLKEKKMSEKTRQPDVVKKERTHKHDDSMKHLHVRKIQNNTALVKDALKKQAVVDSNSQLLLQDGQKKKLYHRSDLLQKSSVVDGPGSVKKPKLAAAAAADDDRKLDETDIATEFSQNNLTGCENGNGRVLQHEIKKEEMDATSKQQLSEICQRADEKLNVRVKKEFGDREVMANRGSSRVGLDKLEGAVKHEHKVDTAAVKVEGAVKYEHKVDTAAVKVEGAVKYEHKVNSAAVKHDDKLDNASKNEHARDATRQRVCRGLYRALSSR